MAKYFLDFVPKYGTSLMLEGLMYRFFKKNLVMLVFFAKKRELDASVIFFGKNALMQ